MAPSDLASISRHSKATSPILVSSASVRYWLYGLGATATLSCTSAAVFWDWHQLSPSALALGAWTRVSAILFQPYGLYYAWLGLSVMAFMFVKSKLSIPKPSSTVTNALAAHLRGKIIGHRFVFEILRPLSCIPRTKCPRHRNPNIPLFYPCLFLAFSQPY